MNKSDGDFQQGGCLYKPNRGIMDTQVLMDIWQVSEKQTSQKWYYGNYLLIGRAIDRQWKTFFPIVCICGGFWQMQSHILRVKFS